MTETSTVTFAQCNRCTRVAPVTSSGVMIRHVTPPSQRARGFICPGSGLRPFSPAVRDDERG